MKDKKKIFIFLISFLVIATIVYVFLNEHAFDSKINDWFVKQTVKDKARDEVVLVIIDDKSLAKERFPWRRSLYANMFDFIQNTAGAKVVVFDALIVSPDNDNLKSDEYFFKKIKGLDTLISGFDAYAAYDSNEILADELFPLFDSKFKNIEIESKTKKTLLPNKGVTNFLHAYLKNIAALGSITVWQDSDGFIRAFPPVVYLNDKFYPSISLMIYSKYTGHKKFILNDKYLCTDDGCKDLKIPIYYSNISGSTIIQTHAKWYSQVADNYSHKKISAIDILESYNLVKEGKEPIVDINELKDKIVLVGAYANAHALQDVKQTPIMGAQSGTDCVATFLDNMLDNKFSVQSTELQNVLVLIVLSALTFLFIMKFSLLTSSLSCFCLFLIYFICYILLMAHSVIIPLLTTFLIQILAMLFGYSYRFILEDTNKKKIQKAMGMYISNDIMKNVVKNIDDVKLGGKRAELSILFADIRGFTSISEKLSPEEVTGILNEYFSEMEPIISKYKGVLNKFIGDAVLVIFGDPIYDKDHALNAVNCANSMLKRVKYLQEKWLAEGKPKIEIGVGINTGEAFVGNIGSQNRLEYTVIGDAVNLASRIEGYNKVYKTRFLISHHTYLKVRNYVDVLKIKDVTIRGKAKKIDIYEVLRMNNDK